MVNTKRRRFRYAFWRSLGVFLLSVPLGTNAVEISNGVPDGTVGSYRVDVETGGQTRKVSITAARFRSKDIFTTEVVKNYYSFVDPGNDGLGFRLLGSDPVPDPIAPNVVTSNGSFFNGNNILWTAVSSIAPGAEVMTTTYRFTAETGVLGPLRFLQHLDEFIQAESDDVFFHTGSAVGGDLELFTFDNTEVYGLSHSGTLLPGTGLQNASFQGWAADRFDNIRSAIVGPVGQPVLPDGVINNLPGFQHPQLGPVFGPADIVSVLAWDVDPNATSAVITTSLAGSRYRIRPSSSFPSVTSSLVGVRTVRFGPRVAHRRERGAPIRST